jgi:hypothetical protein
MAVNDCELLSPMCDYVCDFGYFWRPLRLRILYLSALRAGNENRTRIASLEGWSFTIKLCPRRRSGNEACHEVAGSQVDFLGRAASLNAVYFLPSGY